jgi:hypothetical protein
VPGIDYDAQIEFLNATSAVKYRTGRTPLAALVGDIVPLYGRLLNLLLRAGRDVYARDFNVSLQKMRANALPDARAIIGALETWASGYGFSANPWILEAAHETAQKIALPGSGKPRWYSPTSPPMAPPEPILRGWAYPVESWQSYRENALAQIEYLLKTYKRRVLSTRRLRALDPVTKKHARWTALRVSGLSYGEIAVRTEKAGEAAAKQVIHRETRKFARRIGLVHDSIT